MTAMKCAPARAPPRPRPARPARAAQAIVRRFNIDSELVKWKTRQAPPAAVAGVAGDAAAAQAAPQAKAPRVWGPEGGG